MNDCLQLTLFEQFELDRHLLIIHHQRLGVPSGIVSPLGSNQECRPMLQVSGDLLKSLRKNCDRMLHNAGRESQDDHFWEGRPLSWHSVHRFRESLEHASRQAYELLQSELDRDRFDLFGESLCRSLRRFRHSPSYRYLRRRSAHLKRFDRVGLRFESPQNDRMLARCCRKAGRQMLDIVSLIRFADSLLRPEADGRQITLLMVYSYYACRSLFIKLDDLKRFLPDSHPLAEFLSWSVSGLKMEASRAFRSHLRCLDSDFESDATTFFERVGHALGILQNAFEQTSCGFFQTLDSRFEPQRVFGNPEEKYEETLRLLKDLKWIRQLARRLQHTGSDRDQVRFHQALQSFRNRSFTALFRRDRIPFADFESELRRAQGAALGSTLHHFQVFLSVLLAQIQNRGVLHAVQPSSNGCRHEVPEPTQQIAQVSMN